MSQSNIKLWLHVHKYFMFYLVTAHPQIMKDLLLYYNQTNTLSLYNVRLNATW